MNLRTILMTIAVFSGLSWSAMTETGFAQEPAAPPTSQEKSDLDKVGEQVRDIGTTIDQNETAREISAGILDPIYQGAEWIAFPAFYWVAFMIMAAGVVSFAGQLVFTKFLLLFRGSLNVREIVSDALGLVISVVGLILTTQAATENSSFTASPVAVLSSAGVGAVAGLVFWLWGQRTEMDAVRGAQGSRAKSANEQRRTKM